MTQNQIAYWELEEKKRTNRVQEQETHRHNQTTEFIQAGTLEESKRHNVVSEGIAFGTLAETERSNRAREAETNRSNLANESLKHESNLYTREVGMAQVAESKRHNTATENENARHNMAMEEYNYFSTNVNRQLQERGYDIREGELEVSRGNLELQKEKVYGGTKTDNSYSTPAHGFSSSGRGSSGMEGYTPTLEREIEEKKLEQNQLRLTQEWFSITSNFVKNSSYFLKYAIPEIIPLVK